MAVQRIDGVSGIIQLSQAKNEMGSLIQDCLPLSSMSEARAWLQSPLGLQTWQFRVKSWPTEMLIPGLSFCSNLCMTSQTAIITVPFQFIF